MIEKARLLLDITPQYYVQEVLSSIPVDIPQPASQAKKPPRKPPMLTRSVTTGNLFYQPSKKVESTPKDNSKFSLNANKVGADQQENKGVKRTSSYALETSTTEERKPHKIKRSYSVDSNAWEQKRLVRRMWLYSAENPSLLRRAESTMKQIRRWKQHGSTNSILSTPVYSHL
jgi:hypothetical protein